MIRNTLLAAALLIAAPALAETAAPAPAAKPAAIQAPAPAVMNHQTMRLDVNTATVDQLASVRGLNRPLAEAIVKGRPFKSLDDLTKNKVLTENIFVEVKDHLTIGK